MNSDIRDSDIRAAVERRRADDTKIMQKVNAVNREAFVQKFPRQVEHIMRLTSERSMHCLNKPPSTDLDDPDTWPATAEEIAHLAHALYHIDLVRQVWCDKPTED